MTEATALRPTTERINKADHLADDGLPTKDKPYERPSRLGTAWDRYSRDRDKDGKLLADSDMVLTRTQIATGEAYIAAYAAGMWGGPSGSKYEPSVLGSFTGPPAHALDCKRIVWRMESKVNPIYLRTMLQLVLLDGLSAEEWARRTGRHPKSGIWFLRTVLDMMGGE